MQTIPVPPLTETLKKFASWAKPFLNGVEHEALEYEIPVLEKALAPLQRALQEKAKTKHGYLYNDWIESYLAGRDSLPLSTNFAVEILPLQVKDKLFLNSFIKALALVVSAYQKGIFPKQTDSRGTDIDMSQFKIMQGYCRLPKLSVDEGFFATASRHIAIFNDNVLYRCDILDNGFNVVALPDLTGLTQKSAKGLNRISFMPSNEAVKLREKLLPSNKAYFDTIEQALFVITLTNTVWQNQEEQALFLQGKLGYVSKSMHFIYNSDNQKLWANFEHTYQDAGTLVNILKEVVPLLTDESAIPLVPCRAIEEVLSPQDEAELNKNEETYKNFANKIAIKNLTRVFDKQILAKYSIDAISQALHSYALCKVFGKARGIYEAVAVPHFAYGRTECLRSPSTEMWNFVEALINNKASQEQWQALLGEHKNRIKACKAGLGVERHLLGLKLLKDTVSLTPEDHTIINAFFTSKAYKNLSENFFSSSSLGLVATTGVLIYVPVMPGGYGVAYGYTPDHLCWNLSYYKEKENETKAIILALQEGCKKLEAFLK